MGDNVALQQHTCLHCGKSFENYFVEAKFCSRSCLYAYRRENAKCKTVSCRICGKKFLQARPTVEFCSTECRIESTRDRVECTCDNCGKKYSKKRSDVERSKRHFCSTKCRREAREWSPEDTEILKENYHRLKNEEISNLLSVPRDNDAIKRKALYIGLGIPREWSDNEKNILIENYSKMTIDDLQELLPGRTRKSIIGQARQQGLLSLFYLTHNYSPLEDEYIRSNYLEKTNEEIGSVLGRSASGIAQHMTNLDLHRPTEINYYKNLQNYIRNRIIPWRDKYLASKKYTCEITGVERNVVMHHIRGFNLLLQETMENVNIPLREQISDYSQHELDEILDEFISLQESYNQVVCISESLHKEFHSLYGYGGNTQDQWVEFMTKKAS